MASQGCVRFHRLLDCAPLRIPIVALAITNTPPRVRIGGERIAEYKADFMDCRITATLTTPTSAHEKPLDHTHSKTIHVCAIYLQVDDVYLLAKRFKSKIHDKAVVREEDGLKVRAYVCESKKTGAGARLIKSGEDVVPNKWNRLACGHSRQGMPCEGRGTVDRAAHRSCRQCRLLAGSPNTHQLRLVVVVRNKLLVDVREGSTGKAFKENPGGTPLAELTAQLMFFYNATQHRCTQLQRKVLSGAASSSTSAHFICWSATSAPEPSSEFERAFSAVDFSA